MTTPPSAQSVFVLIATAVYDHGVVGVYESQEEATAVAEELWRQSDGHHEFRVEERTVGVTYDVFERFRYSDQQATTADPRVEFARERDATRWEADSA